MSLGAHIRIDQAANAIPVGTFDAARLDVMAGQLVHFIADANGGIGNSGPSFLLLAGPPGASLTLTNPNSYDATWTPSVPGEYRLELIVSDGLGSNTLIIVFIVSADANGLIYDFGQYGPVYSEQSGENNAAGNAQGYAAPYRAMRQVLVPVIKFSTTLTTNRANVHTSVQTAHYAVVGDGGGDVFDWDATSTAVHNGGTVWQPGFGTGHPLATGRWVSRNSLVPNLRKFGARGNVVEFSDVAVTAASAVVTSASGAFATAVIGQSICIDTPQTQGAGTVSIASGNAVVTGVGTDFVTLHASGVLGIVIGNVTYSLSPISATSASVSPTPAVTLAGAAYFTDISTTTTIIGVASSTSITINITAKVSGTTRSGRFGTDDRGAVIAWSGAVPVGSAGYAPRGAYGMSAGIAFQNRDQLRMFGDGIDKTIFADLRGALATQNAQSFPNPHGLFTFFSTCTNLEIDHLTIRGSGNAQRSWFVDGRAGIWIQSQTKSCRIHDIRADHCEAGGLFQDANGGIAGIDWRSISVDSCQGPSINTGGVPQVAGDVQRISGIRSHDCNSPHIECAAYDLRIDDIEIKQDIAGYGAVEAVQIGVCHSFSVDNVRQIDTKGGSCIHLYVSENNSHNPLRNGTITNVISTGNKSMTGSDSGTDANYGSIIVDCADVIGADEKGDAQNINIGKGCVFSDNGDPTTGLACPGVALVGHRLVGEILIDGMLVTPGTSGLQQIGVKIGHSVPASNKIRIGDNNHFESISQPVSAAARPLYNGWAKSHQSDTDVIVRNSSGVVTIVDPATSATVTFGTAEDDALYSVAGLTPALNSASPAAGSLRASVGALATTGFPITIEAAPGGGKSVDVHWSVRRAVKAVPATSDANLTTNLLELYNFDAAHVTKDGGGNISAIAGQIGAADLSLVTAGKALWIAAASGINAIASDVGSFSALSVYQTAANLSFGAWTIHALVAPTVFDSYLWVHGLIGNVSSSMRLGLQIGAVTKSTPSAATLQQRGVPMVFQDGYAWAVHSATYDGTTMRFFHNGVLQPNYVQIAGVPGTHVEALKFGLGGDPGTPASRAYSGLVRELRVYSAVQTSTQLRRTADYLRSVAAL